MIGKTVSHFRIIDLLGEGGMGVVYLAEDLNLGRRVAMKFLSTTTKEYRARFLREARAVSTLNHPNIAAVFENGETDEGQPYLVMELIEGQTLSEKLQEGSLPLAEAVRIVSYIAEALGEAHRQGVVHRDVKPANVVITGRGQVKVLDFGLVKQISDEQSLDWDPNQKTLPSTRTRSDVIVGTPLYLSPEQATGKTVDGRSDLFALGVVLYECITGQSAFAGGSVIEIGAQVIHVTPTFPSNLNDHIPPELDRITMKAIEKRVEDRYQTADELIADLRRLLPTLETDGYRKGRSTESLQKTRTQSASAITTVIETVRRPGPNLGIFILAILGVALASWVFLWWWKPAPYKPNATAQGWYDKGTDFLRDGAFLQSTKALEQAVAADGNFALAHARLAEAWFGLDYADRAKDEIIKGQGLANHSHLGTRDALYLEAINATIGNQLPAAIRAYTELVQLSPNEPQVYVDLGRAYEKNEEPKQAIASYEEATRRNPQYATAFLRAGILYARQMDQSNAATAFAKADTIYQASGNYEGQAEVAFQRGYMFDKSDKFVEARQQLERALELARTTNNEYQQVKTLQKLGDVEVDANNRAKGRAYMLEALALAQAKGIDNLVKRGLVDLANTFISEGNYSEAEKYAQQSLELSLRQKDTRNAARARLVLASIAERQGNSQQVIDYVEQVLPFYQQGGYRKELLQALALFGRAKVRKGENDSAVQAFEQELKLSQQFKDRAQEALAHEDLALVLLRQGQHPRALEHFEKSYAIARSLELKTNIALTLTGRANALWRLGRYDEARALFGEAAATTEHPDATKNLSGPYYVALARMALSERRFPEAIAKSQRALALVGPQVTRVGIAATYTDCFAQVLSGKSGAHLKCEQALDMARQLGDPALVAEALLTLAQAQLQTNDAAGAMKSSLESQAIFASAPNKDGEWIAWLLAALACRGVGNPQKMREYAERSEQTLGSIPMQWGNDNYNSYLNRPDIKLLHTQLTQLLANKP